MRLNPNAGIALRHPGKRLFHFGDATRAAKKFHRADADISAPPNFPDEGEDAVLGPHAASEGSLHPGQSRQARHLMVPRPDRDGLPGCLDHQAGGKNRVLGKMYGKDPMPGEVHFAAHAVCGHFHHAIDLEHLLDWQVNLGEIGTMINGCGHSPDLGPIC